MTLARSLSAACLVGSAAWTSAALAGCSGGADGSIADGSGASSTASAPDTTAATLSPQGFAVETAPIAVTATSVVFPSTAEVQSFAVGDVIAARSAAVALATPYIRAITAIAVDTPVAGQTTFTTTVSSLDQLLDDADLDQTVAVDDGDDDDGGTDAGPLGLAPDAGVLFPDDLVLLPNGGGKEWDLGNDGDKGKIGLTGGASVNFTRSTFRVHGGVNFVYSTRHWYDPLPKHLRLVLNGSITSQLGAALTTHAALDYTAPEKEYADVKLGTVVVTAGPIPIPIFISMKFSGTASVGLDGAVTLAETATAGLKMAAGFDYTEAHGVTGVHDITHTFSHDPLTVDADVGGTAKLYPLNTEIDFQLFDVAGPYLGVSPYIGVDATKSKGGSAAKVEGIYGVELHTGGQLAVLHHTLARFDVQLADIHGTFAAKDVAR